MNFNSIHKKYDTILYNASQESKWKTIFPTKITLHLYFDKLIYKLPSNEQLKIKRYFYGSPKIHGELICETIKQSIESGYFDQEGIKNLKRLQIDYEEYFKYATITDGMRFNSLFCKVLLGTSSSGKNQVNINEEELRVLCDQIVTEIIQMVEGDTKILPAGSSVHANLIYLKKEKDNTFILHLFDPSNQNGIINTYSVSLENLQSTNWLGFYKETFSKSYSYGPIETFFEGHIKLTNDPLPDMAPFKRQQSSNTCSLMSHELLVRFALTRSTNFQRGLLDYKIFKALLRQNNLPSSDADPLLVKLSQLRSKISGRYLEWQKKQHLDLDQENKDFQRQIKNLRNMTPAELENSPEYIKAAANELQMITDLATNWVEEQKGWKQSSYRTLVNCAIKWLPSTLTDFYDVNQRLDSIYISKMILSSYFETSSSLEIYLQKFGDLQATGLLREIDADHVVIMCRFYEKLSYIDDPVRKEKLMTDYETILKKIDPEFKIFSFYGEKALANIIKEDDPMGFNTFSYFPGTAKINMNNLIFDGAVNILTFLLTSERIRSLNLIKDDSQDELNVSKAEYLSANIKNGRTLNKVLKYFINSPPFTSKSAKKWFNLIELLKNQVSELSETHYDLLKQAEEIAKNIK